MLEQTPSGKNNRRLLYRSLRISHKNKCYMARNGEKIKFQFHSRNVSRYERRQLVFRTVASTFYASVFFFFLHKCKVMKHSKLLWRAGASRMNSRRVRLAKPLEGLDLFSIAIRFQVWFGIRWARPSFPQQSTNRCQSCLARTKRWLPARLPRSIVEPNYVFQLLQRRG